MRIGTLTRHKRHPNTFGKDYHIFNREITPGLTPFVLCNLPPKHLHAYIVEALGKYLRDGSTYKICSSYPFVSAHDQSIIVTHSLPNSSHSLLYTLFKYLIIRKMQFAILFSSLIAATIALPVPQTGVSDPSFNVRYET